MVAPAFGKKDRVYFVGGLADWIGSEPPSHDAIAGAPVLAQAKMHVEAISRTGGAVLGMRPLELDRLEPIAPEDYRVGAVHRVWGWQTIVNHAERLAAQVRPRSSSPLRARAAQCQATEAIGRCSGSPGAPRPRAWLAPSQPAWKGGRAAPRRRSLIRPLVLGVLTLGSKGHGQAAFGEGSTPTSLWRGVGS